MGRECPHFAFSGTRARVRDERELRVKEDNTSGTRRGRVRQLPFVVELFDCSVVRLKASFAEKMFHPSRLRECALPRGEFCREQGFAEDRVLPRARRGRDRAPNFLVGRDSGVGTLATSAHR